MDADPDETTYVFECDACGNVGFGEGRIVCCGEPMQSVGDRVGAVEEPTLEDLLVTVFDMSGTELEVCLCVMEAGEVTVDELAARIDYDRSVVTRHLNHLADLGVVEKRRRLLEQGGHVYVYTPVDPETVRRNLQDRFLLWVGQATEVIEDLSREKVESIADPESTEPQWKIFRE